MIRLQKILFFTFLTDSLVSPSGSACKESACNAGDLGSVSASGKSPGGEHGNPLQYSCWENLMDRRAW